MKKIINNPAFIFIWIFLILLIAFLTVRFLINYRYYSNFDSEDFTPDDLKVLLIGNIAESYVVYYNRGNIEFENGNYEVAITEYNNALDKNPPEKKECKIRINLAFSMLKLLNFGDVETEQKRNELIKKLEDVKKVLTEDGCAHENDNNGHSSDAQQLKNDIDKYIEELKQNQTQKQDPKKEEPNEKDSKEEKVKKELEKLKQESLKNKQEMEELFKEHDYFFDGKTW